jgi:hypothetical protein
MSGGHYELEYESLPCAPLEIMGKLGVQTPEELARKSGRLICRCEQDLGSHEMSQSAVIWPQRGAAY